jgi:hypothetical protein
MNWFRENLTQIVLWIVMVVALLGAYYNATMRLKLSYMIWLVTDAALVWHNFCIGEWQQCILYVVYFCTVVLGIRNTIHQKGWLSRGL